MLSLPSRVDTTAATPLPICLPMASAMPFKSRGGTSPKLRAASVTPATVSTSAVAAPVASLRCSSDTWRSSRRRSSTNWPTRSATSAGLALSSPATSFSRRSPSSTAASAAAPVTASTRRTPALTAPSLTTRNSPMSPVRRTCVPPHSSTE